MKSLLKIMLCLLMLSCGLSKKTVDSKSDKIDISLSSFERDGKIFTLNFSLTNLQKSPITILKPTPWKKMKDYIMNQLYPEFFKLEFHPEEVNCYEGQQIMASILKDVKEFVTIMPKESIEFSIKSNEFYKIVCNENAKELKIVLKYLPDEKLFDKEGFMKEYQHDNRAEEFYPELQNSYSKKIQSDTIRITL